MRQIALFVFRSNNIVCIFQNKLISLQTLKVKLKEQQKSEKLIEILEVVQ